MIEEEKHVCAQNRLFCGDLDAHVAIVADVSTDGPVPVYKASNELTDPARNASEVLGARVRHLALVAVDPAPLAALVRALGRDDGVEAELSEG